MGGAHYTLSIAVSVLPALALLWLFIWLDRSRPEPRRVLYATAVLGALACGPALLIERFEHHALGDAALLGGRFLDAFVVAALTEETLKLIVVLGYAFRQPSFDEVIDGIVYAAAASLGFGLVENIGLAGDDVGLGVLRAISAVPLHALASGVMGYFVGRARHASPNATLPLALVGLFFAVVIHGSYDWAVFNRDAAWMFEAAAVLLASGCTLALLVRHARRMDDAMHGRQSITTMMDAMWPSDVPQTIVPALPPKASQPIESTTEKKS